MIDQAIDFFKLHCTRGSLLCIHELAAVLLLLLLLLLLWCCCCPARWHGCVGLLRQLVITSRSQNNQSCLCKSLYVILHGVSMIASR